MLGWFEMPGVVLQQRHVQGDQIRTSLTDDIKSILLRSQLLGALG